MSEAAREQGGILVVEDCPEDIESLRWAFDRLPMPRPLRHCWSGDEALDLLSGETAGGSRPALLLLDLNLPGTDGLDVLRLIRADGRLDPMPIAILTGSRDRRKAEDGIRLGALVIYRKPDGLPALLAMARDIDARWPAPTAGFPPTGNSIPPGGSFPPGDVSRDPSA